MAGQCLTAALLETCSPFDALSPTLPSPSALLHAEVQRDSFAAGHDMGLSAIRNLRQWAIDSGTPCTVYSVH